MSAPLGIQITLQLNEDMTQQRQYDVLVIGSGAAGLTLALHLASDLRVAVLSKGQLSEGSTFWAQGGVAAVLDDADTVDAHVQDTLIAGGGLCHEDAVRQIVGDSRDAIGWLVEQGVPFTRERREDGSEADDFHLTREGGHSHRRIIHAADATGAAIFNTLLKRAEEHSNIELLDNRVAVDLITSKKLGRDGNLCLGAYVLNRSSGHVETVAARFTVLATGGASKVYLYTSNPDSASGDGIAMAWRAGCRVANMEFNQFHPTCLYHPKAKSFLITEALRGEGALLRLPNGERFMPRFDERAELAPRDIVARAVFAQTQAGLAPALDTRTALGTRLSRDFPAVAAACQQSGLDPLVTPIPVAAAAHYHMGGIATDAAGRTSLEGLWACGEVASTGLHGANRLASNGLLEALVYGRRAAVDMNAVLGPIPKQQAGVTLPDLPPGTAPRSDLVNRLRQTMTHGAGVIRTAQGLQRSLSEIAAIEADQPDSTALANMTATATLIASAALRRRESRGAHFRSDHPECDGATGTRSFLTLTEARSAAPLETT